MSKKTLLNETQVRRFMKLANVGTLTDGFVSNLSEAGYFDNPLAEEEEELPGEDDEGMGALDAAAPEDEEGPMDDEPMDMDEPAMDDAVGDEMSPEVVAKVEDILGHMLGAAVDAVKEKVPEADLSIDDGSDMDDLDAMPPAEEPMDAMGDEEEPMGDMDAMGDEEDDMPADLDDEAMGGRYMEESASGDAELVEAIVKRVAARLRELT